MAWIQRGDLRVIEEGGVILWKRLRSTSLHARNDDDD